ncbi:MAG: helix-turn-helix domain-containing protein [Bacilli bacterium]|nr:helix-turn-helix domain-containing protein [Bacilli bacterium]
MAQSKYPDAKQIGERLGKLISKKGLTREQAAERLGYEDDRQLRRWIANGVAKIDTIIMICEIFDIDMKEFLFPEE